MMAGLHASASVVSLQRRSTTRPPSCCAPVAPTVDESQACALSATSAGGGADETCPTHGAGPGRQWARHCESTVSPGRVHTGCGPHVHQPVNCRYGEAAVSCQSQYGVPRRVELSPVRRAEMEFAMFDVSPESAPTRCSRSVPDR